MPGWLGLAVALFALACSLAAVLVQRRNIARVHRVRKVARLIRYGVAIDLERDGYPDAATAARCAADWIDRALDGRL